MINVSLPVKRKDNNSKTNSVNSIYLFNFVNDSSRRIQRYQTWRDSTKLKIMMISFPVFEELTFLDVPRPIRIYIFVSQSKVKIYGSFRRKKCYFRFRKKCDNPKTTRYNPRILYIWIHLLGTNPNVPNMTEFDKVEIMMTLLPGFRLINALGVPRPIRIYIDFLMWIEYLRHF